MKVIIKEIVKQLRKIANKIEADTCELTEEQALNLFAVIGTELLSKEQACSYLNVSRSTFDNMVRDGEIPKGRKIRGFKELFWNKNDLIIQTYKNNK